MQDIRCRWLPNGFLAVRSYRSGLEALYDPQADEIRDLGFIGALGAARAFMRKHLDMRGVVLPHASR